MRLLPLTLMACSLAFPIVASAQFDSGSDEADGALNITENTDLQIQEDGVHNYTTINIDNGVTLTLLPNTTNTPVIFLASGAVTISGTIDISGENGLQGSATNAGATGSEALGTAGGFAGGRGGIAQAKGGTNRGTSGAGPGGGAAPADNFNASNAQGKGGNGGSHFTQGAIGFENGSPAAPTYGDSRLITLTAGSGGSGGNMRSNINDTRDGPGGGAGGGAICIASSTTISVSGEIDADGGNGGGGDFATINGAGGGAGGAIRLMANTVSGSGSLFARGGTGSGAGGDGLIRIEAFDASGSIIPNSDPSPAVSVPTIVSLPPGLLPTITITSIGGEAVPGNASGSLTMPDVVIPDTVNDPVEIQISTTNVPDGAVIKLRIVQDNGDTIFVDSTAVSSNSATASTPINSGIGAIYARADFNP